MCLPVSCVFDAGWFYNVVESLEEMPADKTLRWSGRIRMSPEKDRMIDQRKRNAATWFVFDDPRVLMSMICPPWGKQASNTLPPPRTFVGKPLAPDWREARHDRRPTYQAESVCGNYPYQSVSQPHIDPRVCWCYRLSSSSGSDSHTALIPLCTRFV